MSSLPCRQRIALGGVTEEELKRIIIAYEPVWAIGTGKTATAEQANEVCAVIRATVKSLYGETAAEGITVQYGGSMNAGTQLSFLHSRTLTAASSAALP